MHLHRVHLHHLSLTTQNPSPASGHSHVHLESLHHDQEIPFASFRKCDGDLSGDHVHPRTADVAVPGQLL